MFICYTFIVIILINICYIHSIHGQGDGDLRFYDSGVSDPYGQLYGQLQMYFSGSWGWVCDDNMRVNEAEVACRQMGFHDAVNYARLEIDNTGYDSATLYNPVCTGTEDRLTDCLNTGHYYDNCIQRKRLGAICNLPGYVDCYEYMASTRPFDYTFDESEIHTIEECVNSCTGIRYRYAAVYGGTTCVCDHGLNLEYLLTMSTRCQVRCQGDTGEVYEEYCGGDHDSSPVNEYISLYDGGWCDSPPISDTATIQSDDGYYMYGSTLTYQCSNDYYMPNVTINIDQPVTEFVITCERTGPGFDVLWSQTEIPGCVLLVDAFTTQITTLQSIGSTEVTMNSTQTFVEKGGNKMLSKIILPTAAALIFTVAIITPLIIALKSCQPENTPVRKLGTRDVTVEFLNYTTERETNIDRGEQPKKCRQVHFTPPDTKRLNGTTCSATGAINSELQLKHITPTENTYYTGEFDGGYYNETYEGDINTEIVYQSDDNEYALYLPNCNIENSQTRPEHENVYPVAEAASDVYSQVSECDYEYASAPDIEELDQTYSNPVKENYSDVISDVRSKFPPVETDKSSSNIQKNDHTQRMVGDTGPLYHSGATGECIEPRSTYVRDLSLNPPSDENGFEPTDDNYNKSLQDPGRNKLYVDINTPPEPPRSRELTPPSPVDYMNSAMFTTHGVETPADRGHVGGGTGDYEIQFPESPVYINPPCADDTYDYYYSN